MWNLKKASWNGLTKKTWSNLHFARPSRFENPSVSRSKALSCLDMYSLVESMRPLSSDHTLIPYPSVVLVPTWSCNNTRATYSPTEIAVSISHHPWSPVTLLLNYREAEFFSPDFWGAIFAKNARAYRYSDAGSLVLVLAISPSVMSVWNTPSRAPQMGVYHSVF